MKMPKPPISALVYESRRLICWRSGSTETATGCARGAATAGLTSGTSTDDAIGGMIIGAGRGGNASSTYGAGSTSACGASSGDSRVLPSPPLRDLNHHFGVGIPPPLPVDPVRAPANRVLFMTSNRAVACLPFAILDLSRLIGHYPGAS